jgi:hypothetical protein
LNDIGRNSLLGNRKKLAKFLMRTFTCRSTFLYALDSRLSQNIRIWNFFWGVGKHTWFLVSDITELPMLY